MHYTPKLLRAPAPPTLHDDDDAGDEPAEPARRGVTYTTELLCVESETPGWRRRFLVSANPRCEPCAIIETSSPHRTSRILWRRDANQGVLDACALVADPQFKGIRQTGVIPLPDGACFVVSAHREAQYRFRPCITFQLVGTDGDLRGQPKRIFGDDELTALTNACAALAAL